MTDLSNAGEDTILPDPTKIFELNAQLLLDCVLSRRTLFDLDILIGLF